MRSATKIFGEDLDDLLPLIAALEYKVTSTKKVWISSHDIPGSQLAPLLRALMRAEAEVLVDEASGIDTKSPSTSTPKERRVEAFGRVFRATGVAEGERYKTG
jgi:hypothetical protein